MATEAHECGGSTIQVDTKCGFSCSQISGGRHGWTISCPGPDGTTIITWGTTPGMKTPPPPPHHSPLDHNKITVSGPLKMLAATLEDDWKRPVTVPGDLKDKTIGKKTLKGTQEEIAKELGLTLGPKG
jgi:hypothetical protein